MGQSVVWLALSTEPYSCPTACAIECWLNQAWSQGRGRGSTSIICPNAPKPLQGAVTHMQVDAAAMKTSPRVRAELLPRVCRKPITDQCRVDCSSFNLAGQRVLPCKLVRKLDINRLSSANKWFLPSPLSPADQVTGAPREPSELTHCGCTGMGNPQPRACQWKHPAINSPMSKSRNCNWITNAVGIAGKVLLSAIPM